MEDEGVRAKEEAYVEIPQIVEEDSIDFIDVWDPGPITIDTGEDGATAATTVDEEIIFGGHVQHEYIPPEEVTPDYGFIFG